MPCVATDATSGLALSWAMSPRASLACTPGCAISPVLSTPSRLIGAKSRSALNGSLLYRCGTTDSELVVPMYSE
ncbi:hypothetical protein D3C85_1402290 [compost metagenome]